MSPKNLIALLFFILVLVCWGLFFVSAHFELISVAAAPAFGVAGFVLSVLAFRKKEMPRLSLTLLVLHSLVIATYTLGVIYMAFFWNPRFF